MIIAQQSAKNVAPMRERRVEPTADNLSCQRR
jgi:hypothetical protein